MVNDVAALAAPGAIEAVAGSDAAVCLMHMQGEPGSMQDEPRYGDVVEEVRGFLREPRRRLRERGHCALAPGSRSGIRLRQGPGTQPGSCCADLGTIASDGLPVLAGLSRKRMIGALTGRDEGDRLAGSVAAAVVAAMHGARIIRAHDVRETADALRVVAACGAIAGQSGMSMRYFGTDGVRGRVGTHPMTVEFALRLAGAAARVLAPSGGRVLVGKDTRLSGYMFEAALEAGFVAAGVDVLLAGPLPTPGIAYLVQRLGCDFGAVISASHNRYDDNGIKFFDREGSKLADELEEAIESHLDEPALTRESGAAWPGDARGQRARAIPGILRIDAASWHAPRRAQARHRLRERRGLQGGAARPRGPRRRNRADRLLAEWPQHQ